MKKLLFLVLLFFAVQSKGQTFRLDTFYNFKHNALWNTPYAVNEDLDTSLGWTVGKTILKIKKTKMELKSFPSREIWHYRIDSVESFIPNVYTIYHTWNKEFNIECTFIISVNEDRTFVYDVWKKSFWVKQGWVSTIPNKKKK